MDNFLSKWSAFFHRMPAEFMSPIDAGIRLSRKFIYSSGRGALSGTSQHCRQRRVAGAMWQEDNLRLRFPDFDDSDGNIAAPQVLKINDNPTPACTIYSKKRQHRAV